MAKAAGRDHLEVNSVHHQAVRDLGDGLIATGWAPDGIIEALEWHDDSWLLWAIQWHPEWLGPDDAPSLSLFETLVGAAG